jgi:Na+-driven multidrug efflux pump
MSVNILIDTIFVGQWIGSIAAQLFCTYNILNFILGMAIGVGGGSVLSRALSKRSKKANSTFGEPNHDDLFFAVSIFFAWLGIFL